jgi:excisionase family DNA binding protein
MRRIQNRVFTVRLFSERPKHRLAPLWFEEDQHAESHMPSMRDKQQELFPTEPEARGRANGSQKRRHAQTPVADKRCEPLLTVKEAAERCSLSTRQMWRHIHEGHLIVVRLGRAVRIRPSDLERFISGQWQ